jgi:hypothetical protein
MGPNRTAQPTSERTGTQPWIVGPDMYPRSDPETTTTAANYPYAYENSSGFPTTPQEVISASEFGDIQHEVEEMVDVIAAEIKSAERQRDETLKKALETRLESVNKLLIKPQENTERQAEQLAKQTKKIKAELENLPEYKKLQDLKKQAEQVQAQKDPAAHAEALTKFKENAADFLNINGETAPELKSGIEKLVTETNQQIKDLGKEKSDGKNPKPGFWQVFMVKMLHFFHLDSYDRVKTFLAKSGNIKSTELDSFIARYFPDVSAKHQAEQEKDDQQKTERPVTETNEQASAPLSKATVEARPGSPATTPQPEPELKKPIEARKLQNYGETKTVLNMISGGVENPMVAARNSTEALLNELETADKTADPKARLNYRTRALAELVYRKNSPLTYEQADKYLDVLDEQQNYPDETAPEVRISPKTVEAAKAAVHDMIDAKKQQYEEVKSWYDTGVKRADELSAGKPEQLTAEERAAAIEKGMALCFIDKIVAKREELGLFQIGNIYHDPDKDTTTNLLKAAVETGAIHLVFHSNEYGSLTPALIVDDFELKDFLAELPEQDKTRFSEQIPLKEGTTKLDAELLMAVLYGHNNLHELAKDTRQAASGWSFPFTGVAVVNKTLNLEDGSGNKPTILERDEILAHEIQHALNLNIRLTVKQQIQERSLKATMEGKWAEELATDLTAEANATAPEAHFTSDQAKEMLKDYLATKDVAAFAEKYKHVPKLVEKIVASEKLAEQTAPPQNNEVRKFFGLGRIRREFQKEIDQISTPLDELTAQAKSMTLDMALGDVGITEFDPNKPEHAAVLGMIRMFNVLKSKENETGDLEKRARLENGRIVLADYLANAFHNFKPSSAELVSLISTASSDPDHLLHPVLTELEATFGKLSVDYLVSNLVGAFNKDLDVAGQGALKVMVAKYLETDPKNKQARSDLLTQIKEKYFPEGNFPEYLFEKLTLENAGVMGMLFNPSDREKVANVPAITNCWGYASNPRADIRWTATHANNAYYWGKTPKGDRVGDTFGGKLDFFMNYKHPKDKGNPLLRIGGIDHKVLMDGFGFGLDEFRLDSNDRLEAISYVTGIPVHRFPFLNKLLGDWELPAWNPKGITDATPNMYTHHVLTDIYGRLAMERNFDGQSMIRLITEFGGFDYDLNGQPTANMRSYATKDDDYRLNTQLANFVENELDKKDATGAWTRKDLELISKRLKSDKLMLADGSMVDVEYKMGWVMRAGFENELTLSGQNLNDVLHDETQRAAAIRSGKLIQQGRLKLGQMTDNMMNEIIEVMEVHENSKKKFINPVGRTAADYEREQKAAWGDLAQRENYKKIAKAMMQEDAKRRAEGGSYTMTDLYEELERMQGEPQSSIYNDDGTINEEHKQRYLKPKIKIGGVEVEHSVAKRFFMEFSLARSKKVLSVGVWGKEPDYYKDAAGKPDTHDYLDNILTAGGVAVPDLSRVKAELSMNLPEAIKLVETSGYTIVPSNNENEKGVFFTKNGTNEKYLLVVDDSSIYRGPQVKGLRRVNQTEKIYSKKGKLEFVNKLNGFKLPLDPIQNLSTDVLYRYFGKTYKYDVIGKDGKPVTVTAHSEHSTNVGVMFDDVYDSITKIQQGRDMNYKYSIKLNQMSTYREYCKIKREFYDGLVMLDSTARNAIIAATLIGALVPGLAVLANPALLCGMIVWSLGVSPFFQRGTKGWGTREIAAIQAQGKLGEQGQYFWRLADEDHPPSFGELDIARGVFESVKFDYRSMCKSMTADAKWDTNVITGLFNDLWPRVSAKPF